MPKTPEYATKKELQKHKKEVEKMIKSVTKGLKKWDIKQDKKLIKNKVKK